MRLLDPIGQAYEERVPANVLYALMDVAAICLTRWVVTGVLGNDL